MNFMTAFPLIISSFCIPGPPALIQSTADSKRGIDSFSLNSASSPAPAIVLILNVRPVPDEGFIYISIYIYAESSYEESGPIAFPSKF